MGLGDEAVKAMKKHELLTLLLKEPKSTAYVHLDPRKAGCWVPAKFKSQEQMVLQVGRNMEVPIDFLRWDSTELTGVFSFAGVGFSCIIPMDAIFAIVSDQGAGAMYSKDIPEEVLEQMAEKSRVQKMPSQDFKRADGTYDLTAYRQHKKPR